MAHLVFAEITALGIQSLEHAKRLGHEVTLFRSPVYDFVNPPEVRRRAAEIADRTILLDDLQGPHRLLDALRAGGVDPDGVDAVFSTLSLCTYPAAQLAELIGARGTPSAAVEAARDKGRCREILHAAGVPSLGHEVVTTAAQALAAAEVIGYPVIIKPVYGVGKAVMTIAHSAADVRRHFDELDDELRLLNPGHSGGLDERFVVEELAVGELYSVELATDGAASTPLVTVGRKVGRDNPVLEMGCVLPSGLDPDLEQELGEYCALVCRTLGLDLGVFHVEVMHTAKGFRLIEANPRISGGSLPDTVRLATGGNIFEIVVDLFLGRPVPARPLPVGKAVNHLFLASAVDATVRADLPADWFEEFRPRIHSGWTRVGAGDRVSLMKGNFDPFGMIRVVADDVAVAQAECAAVRADIEQTLGIPLTPLAPRHEVARYAVR